MAGAALFPQAAMRSAGAVRDFSDSSLIIRLTRGRGWIAVLCALLGGIVAAQRAQPQPHGGLRPHLAADRRAEDRGLRAAGADRREALRRQGGGGGREARAGVPGPEGDHLPERVRRRRRARRASARHRRLPAGAEPAVELSGARDLVRAGPDDEPDRDDRRPRPRPPRPTTTVAADHRTGSQRATAGGSTGSGTSSSGASSGSSTATTGGVGL